MPLTLQDVANHAGVSKKTVSRVINNETRVADVTRAKVVAAIEELGFVPNIWAQRLARGHSGTIGFLMHDSYEEYNMSIINGMMDVVEQNGYRISVHRVDIDRPNHEHVVNTMIKQRLIEALIVTPPYDNSPVLIETLIRNDFPFVLLTPHQRRSDIAWVTATDELGSYELTRYLLELGHFRIGYILGDRRHQATWDRLRGYKRALSDEGYDADETIIKQGDWSFESGLKCATELLLLQSEAPTAIVAANDVTAAGVLQAIWECGLHCPEHVSVAGFDDVPLASYVSPPLTTVRQPIHDIATAAVSMLVEALHSGKFEPRSVELPTRLVVRKSSRAKIP